MKSVREFLGERGSIIYAERAGRSFALRSALDDFWPKLAPPFCGNYANIQELANLIEKFHSTAGTNTPYVSRAIDSLRSGATGAVRFFHQPNTLSALNICGQAYIGDHLAKRDASSREKAVSLFILMDYDEADDKRFRTPILPSVRSAKVSRLTGAVPSRVRHQVACSLATPSLYVVDTWLGLLEEAARHWIRALRSAQPLLTSKETQARFDEFSATFRKIFASQHSLTMANSIANSWLTNVAWGLDTLFVPGSWLLRLCYPKLIEVLRSDDAWYAAASESSAVLSQSLRIARPAKQLHPRRGGSWRVCPRCFSRNHLDISITDHGTQGRWSCARCGDGAVEYIDEYAEVMTQVGSVPRVMPAVLLCDLLEIISYGLPAGVSYAGSADHVLWSRVAGVFYAPSDTEDLFWEPRNIFERFDDGSTAGEALVDGYKGSAPSPSQVFSSGRAPAIFYWLMFADSTLREGIIRSLANKLDDKN